MEDNAQSKQIEEKLRVENQFKGGASWFFWIAGLSLINSIILLTGGEWSFIVGLGITQIIDSFANEIGTIGKIVAIILDIIAAGVFVVFGVFAKKRHSWAFIVGMVLYAFDGLLFLLVQDWLSIGFHIFALFCIFGGFKANKKLEEIEQSKVIST